MRQEFVVLVGKESEARPEPLKGPADREPPLDADGAGNLAEFAEGDERKRYHMSLRGLGSGAGFETILQASASS